MHTDTKIMVNAFAIGALTTLLTAIIVWVEIELDNASMVVFPAWVKWAVSIVIFCVYGEYSAKPFFQAQKKRARRRKWEAMKKVRQNDI